MSTSERAQSDFKKLKTKYSSQLSTLKELFTEWTEEDLLFTVQDADGDLELAIDRISEGHASQWGEVKTKKSKKEAAAANKVSLEVSSTTISYPPSVTRPARPASSTTKRPSTNSRQKPSTTITTTAAAASWQTKKLDDSWNTNDAWSQSNPTVETPKKTSTPSSSTKTSNGGGAKTWASLLQKPDPVVEAEPVAEQHEPELQKVDDAWLSSDSNQWDQPLQLPTLDKRDEEQEVVAVSQPIEKDITVDFNKISLQEVPEKTSSNHPSVADILNSVKQQPSTSNTTDTTSSTSTQPPIDQHLYQQQQLYNQQPQYQQFGSQDYNSSFNANDYGSSNYYGQEEKTDALTQSYPQQPLYNQQQQQQSFYPYYYTPNQFNAYSPYGQQAQTGANAFMNGRNNRYPTSVYGQQKTSTSSPYLNSSPYNPTQPLYGGFNQFYGSAQAPVGNESPEKTAKSPPASTQAYQANTYFGQSPMFGYGQQQQQQQQYRNDNTNQYWNQ